MFFNPSHLISKLRETREEHNQIISRPFPHAFPRSSRMPTRHFKQIIGHESIKFGGLGQDSDLTRLSHPSHQIFWPSTHNLDLVCKSQSNLSQTTTKIEKYLQTNLIDSPQREKSFSEPMIKTRYDKSMKSLRVQLRRRVEEWNHTHGNISQGGRNNHRGSIIGQGGRTTLGLSWRRTRGGRG